MSADNGIYVVKFPDGYRVIEAQAIENCLDSPGFPNRLTDAYRACYFGNSRVYPSREAAEAEASMMYDEIMKGDWPVLEYGISSLEFDRGISMTKEEANQVIDEFWNRHASYQIYLEENEIP